MPEQQAQLLVEGKIRSLHFSGQSARLPLYDFETFNINTARSAGLVRFGTEVCIAYSKWSSPKRTRTYPFARIYDTYSHGGKIVTIIPVVKDEGAGKSQNDTNLDRINYITYSWMNLTNIYIILAWYKDASKKSENRITHQRMDNDYIRTQMERIIEYKLDAHHWNQEHFQRDFIPVYEQAMEAYKQIAQKLKVAMHSEESHRAFLASVKSAETPDLLDINRFRDLTLRRSHLSAQHETVTQHEREDLSGRGKKALFHLQNYLGGVYYLTADEVYLVNNDTLIIRECKTTSQSFLPAISDIKDGLFKLILFSHLENVSVGGRPVSTSVELRLTSNRLQEILRLPAEASVIQEYAGKWKVPPRTRSILHWLNEESRRMNVPIVIEGAGTQNG